MLLYILENYLKFGRQEADWTLKIVEGVEELL